MERSELFGAFTARGCCANEPSTPEPPLTLEKIREAKELLGTSPRLPQLAPHPISWPMRQARTHRKRRINKKWRKRYGMVPDTSVDHGQVYLVNAPQFASGRPGFPSPSVSLVVAYPKTFALLWGAYRDMEVKAWG